MPEHLPLARGFDHQYGHFGWGIDYNNYAIPHNAPARFAVYDWHRNQQPLNEQGYATDLFANETVRLLSEQTPERPFFLYVAFNAIHGPLEEIPRYTDELDKREATLKCLDDAVGRIVEAVEQYGFADNTLIILTNDNGGLRPEYNRPYRGTKNTNYEGGVRVSCVMRFDGLDMTAAIFAGAPSPRREIVFEVSGSVRPPAIRSGDFNLIGDELYNLADDPSETTDIAAERPEVVRRLKARLEEMGRQRPPLADLIGEAPLLMEPPLPYIYGRDENRSAPEWVKRRVRAVRATQPTEWAPGETPWPQAPKDGKIIYTGDGR